MDKLPRWGFLGIHAELFGFWGWSWYPRGFCPQVYNKQGICFGHRTTTSSSQSMGFTVRPHHRPCVCGSHTCLQSKQRCCTPMDGSTWGRFHERECVAMLHRRLLLLYLAISLPSCKIPDSPSSAQLREEEINTCVNKKQVNTPWTNKVSYKRVGKCSYKRVKEVYILCYPNINV